jgi:hypothetical protein
MIILVLVGIVVFAYVALNAGERAPFRPGIARPLTIGLIVLVAWFCWPLYSHLLWFLPK